jgi:hypothetical protein
MNNRLIQSITKHLARITMGVLIALSTGFILSRLPAQTPTPCPSVGTGCADWPCPLGPACDPVHVAVEKEFVKLLNDASTETGTGPQLRKDLLCQTNNFQLAHKRVEERLKGIPAPLGPVPFGPEHHVMFYEAEKPTEDDPGVPPVHYPENHCIHIFYLQKVGTILENDSNAETLKSVKRHLKCCYQPW